MLKTSNAGGDVQDLKLSDGRPLWHQVAELVASWGEDLLIGDCGLLERRRGGRGDAPA